LIRMTAHPRYVYRLCRSDDWKRTQQTKMYLATDFDLRDGFIHMSTSKQAKETAQTLFRGVTDLIALQIDTEKLGNVVWDAVPERRNELFPHYYPAKVAVQTSTKSTSLDAVPSSTPTAPRLFLPLACIIGVHTIPFDAGTNEHLFPDLPTQ